MRTASPYLALALIAGVAAMAWGLIQPALWAEGGSADPHVSEKPGTVSNVGDDAEKIDHPGEEEEKVPDYVEVGPTTTLIQSLPYNPPIGWAFNPFPQPNPWEHVDIHNKPPDAIQKGVVPPTSLNDTAGRVRIEGWFYNASVPDWPLRCEGNLKPPPGGGGGGPKEWHWSAKVAKLLVDLDINTDDKPRIDDKIPIVSLPAHITAADEPREVSPGGYIWVNDDNDHNTGPGDQTLDKEDSGYAGDNDLEPVKYAISDEYHSAPYTIEISCSAPEFLYLWKDAGKQNRFVFPSANQWIAFEDYPEDGLLYAEGIKPTGDAGVHIRLRVRQEEEKIAEDEIAVTVFGVSIVQWRDGADTLVGTDPSANRPDYPADGQRVFPDYVSLSEMQQHTVRRDMPRIEVYLAGKALDTSWRVPVYVRVWDIDHYSPDGTDSSGDQWLDPNGGYEPRDNCTGYTDFRETGNELHISLEVVDESVAKKIVENEQDLQFALCASDLSSGCVAQLEIVHSTPCNNWKASAGCGDTMSDAVRITTESHDGAIRGASLEYINGTPLSTATWTATKSTCTLTVWRKLYVQTSRLDLVDWEEGPEDERSLQDGAGTLSPEGHVVTEIDVGCEGQFQGGLCNCYDDDDGHFLDQRAITGNTAGSDVIFYISSAAPGDTRYVYVQDDDVTEGTGNYPDYAPISPKVQPGQGACSKWNDPAYFPGACVLVDTDQLGGNVVGFDLHLPLSDMEQVAATAKAGLRGGQLFWVATWVKAYQFYYHMQGTNDPSVFFPFGLRVGVCLPYWYSSFGADSIGTCFVFAENLRDFCLVNWQTEYEQAVLHEIAHLVGGQHGDLGILGDQYGHSQTPSFSPKTCRRIMLLHDTGPSWRM